jgi:hypothetical protein
MKQADKDKLFEELDSVRQRRLIATFKDPSSKDAENWHVLARIVATVQSEIWLQERDRSRALILVMQTAVSELPEETHKFSKATYRELGEILYGLRPGISLPPGVLRHTNQTLYDAAKEMAQFSTFHVTEKEFTRLVIELRKLLADELLKLEQNPPAPAPAIYGPEPKAEQVQQSKESEPVSLEKQPQPLPEPITTEPDETPSVWAFREVDAGRFDTAPWSTPEDDALALLAFSSGKRGRLPWVGEFLFRVLGDDGSDLGWDVARYQTAARLARKRGINRTQCLIAREEFAARGALAIPPGEFIHLAHGLKDQRLTSGLRHGYGIIADQNVKMREFQRTCLERGGRLDLAGDWTDVEIRRHGDDIARRAGLNPWQGASHAIMFNALLKASLEQLVTAHPLALLQFGTTARVFFTHGTPGERAGMAIWLLELVGSPNRHTARGDSKQYVSTVLMGLREFGITSRELPIIADQLANAVGPITTKENFSGADLLADTRLPR